MCMCACMYICPYIYMNMLVCVFMNVIPKHDPVDNTGRKKDFFRMAHLKLKVI